MISPLPPLGKGRFDCHCPERGWLVRSLLTKVAHDKIYSDYFNKGS